MAFCKFSTEIVSNKYTNVDNTFLERYLRFANGDQIKVYIWGLYLCSNPQNITSNLCTIQSFSENLGMTEDAVLQAFEFWENQGLVQIVTSTPPEILYLPLKDAIVRKKYVPAKYEQFNLQAQSILKDRQITQYEYQSYYDLMETFNIQQDAMLMIMQYCVDAKGSNVGYSYIITVAKNWGFENGLTLQQVENKLQQFNLAEKNTRAILKAMGSSKTPNFEEKQLYLKWSEKLDFSLDVLVFVASKMKKASFDKLDIRLTKYFELHLFSIKEIENYEEQKDNLFGIAKEITKTIGVYYENLEPVVENYINQWLMRGFAKETLLIVSNYCFKNSIRSLEGMNNIVQKLYQQGITSVESIAQFIDKAKTQDENIKKVLNSAKLLRNVTSFDRDFYRTWTYSWNMSQDMIEYAGTLACDKGQPMQYINKILGSWYEQKISTLEDAKNTKQLYKYTSPDSASIHSRTYTKEELDNLFSNIDEVEI